MIEESVSDLAIHGQVVEEFGSSTTSRTWYHYVLLAACVVFAAVSVGFVGSILQKSLPTWLHHPATVITGSGWQSPTGPFGGLAMIVGTLETSLIALVIAVLIGLGTSISIVFFIPRRLRNIVATLVELLAAVPSIVYGLWGYLVLAPWMYKSVDPWLNSWPFARTLFGDPSQQSYPRTSLKRASRSARPAGRSSAKWYCPRRASGCSARRSSLSLARPVRRSPWR